MKGVKHGSVASVSGGVCGVDVSDARGERRRGFGRRLNHLTDAELVRYWRLAVKSLHKYQTRRAFDRLYFIVAELDARGI